jgi:hypothetical protein
VKEKIRGAEINLLDFFPLCSTCQKNFSVQTFHVVSYSNLYECLHFSNIFAVFEHIKYNLTKLKANLVRLLLLCYSKQKRFRFTKKCLRFQNEYNKVEIG